MTRSRISPTGLAVLTGSTLSGCALLPAPAAPPAPPGATPAPLPWRIEPLQRTEHALPAAESRAGHPADQLHREALLLASRGRLREALLRLDSALALAPHQAALHNNRGFLLMQVGRLPEARQSLQAALALDPSLRRAQVNLDRLEAPAAAATGQAPATPLAQAPAPSAEAASLAGLRVRIVNGHGQPGAAGLFARSLASQGLAQVRLANRQPFDTRQTEIGYRPGQATQAQALAARLPVAATLRERPDLRDTDLHVVLGQDLRLATTTTPPTARRALATMPAGSHQVRPWNL
ncbi:MAG: hypothetical protein RLZZ592_1007 [Pseudomonadota bacterium]|jgi:tetratricopeptide (TPR) repeat protein